jgi:hypothetical protein
MVRHLHEVLVQRGAKLGGPDDDEEELAQQTPLPKDCCACIEKVSTILFARCGHLCMCGQCRDALLQGLRMYPLGQRQVTCPVCRRLHAEQDLVRVILN